MAPVHQLDPYKVQEIVVLGKENEAKAREMLEAVAKQVQPLLRRHKLRVPLLSEFYPHNPNLLGLNIGGGGGDTQEIRIRLRRAGCPLDFYDFDHTLGTMLHEITHNTHGRHDAAFYKQLDKYTEECEELLAKGISGTGAGFDAPAAGKVGGRFVGRELALHARRELALKAAQERAKKQAIMPGGPNKLGGDLTLRLACDPREAAAIAAERRARDNLWCPNEKLREEAAAGQRVDSALQRVLEGAVVGQEQGTGATAAPAAQPGSQRQQKGQQQQKQKQKEEQQRGGSQQAGRYGSLPQRRAAVAAQAAQQEEERGRQPRTADGAFTGLSALPSSSAAAAAAAPAPSASEFIDLTGDDENINTAAAGAPRARSAAAAAASMSTNCGLPHPKRPKPAGGVSASGPSSSSAAWGGGWSCALCTLVNRAMALQCDACGSLRPAGFTAP